MSVARDRHLLRRLIDWFRTSRTMRRVADRECRHDGSEPRCVGCERSYTVW